MPLFLLYDLGRIRFRRGFRFLTLLAVLLVSQPAPVRAAVFNPETFTLANGMQVVVVTNRRAPVVSHMVWFKAGSADEPRGKSGIAHFLEHLMFKGTPTVPPGEFSKIIQRNGGQLNAFTSWDYTAYYEDIARDRLELAMKMEADRMQNLRLTDEIVTPERAVIIEERKQRTDNNPSARLWEQIYAALYIHHPYGTPIIGWQHEMEGLTRQDALDWVRDWYAPNNAILVVTGDIDAKELRPLAESIYGVIPARPVPARRRVQEPPVSIVRRLTLVDAQVRQPSWQRVWLAPSQGTGPANQVAALEVLDSILSGGQTSRFYKSLVVEQKLATSAGMFYSGSGLDRGMLGISASPLPDGDLTRLEAAMEAEVARLLKDGVTQQELDLAKRKLQRQAIFARDGLQAAAQSFGSALTSGGTIDTVEKWPERIAAVTVAEVNEAARLVFSQPGHVTGVLLPDPKAAPAGPAGPAEAAPPTSAGGHSR